MEKEILQWVKASERLPEVMLGESKQFVVRHIETSRFYFSWYGKSNICKLNRFPHQYEWLEGVKSNSIINKTQPNHEQR